MLIECGSELNSTSEPGETLMDYYLDYNPTFDARVIELFLRSGYDLGRIFIENFLRVKDVVYNHAIVSEKAKMVFLLVQIKGRHKLGRVSKFHFSCIAKYSGGLPTDFIHNMT